MQKDFITVTPDSGGSGSTTVTVAAPANQTESTRSTSLSVAGGGMTRTVGASQAAGVVTWKYYFSITPTSLSFVAGGETKSVTVTSYRKKVINGVETSTQENVPWTVTGSSGFHTLTNRIAADPNTSNGIRTGTATYKQNDSNKTVTVNLEQASPKVNTLTLKLAPSGMSLVTLYLFKLSPLGGSPSKYSPPSFSGTGTQTQFLWNNIRGLEVFDSNSAAKVFAHAGDSIIIAVKNPKQDAWANFMVIILQDNDQTIQAPIIEESSGVYLKYGAGISQPFFIIH